MRFLKLQILIAAFALTLLNQNASCKQYELVGKVHVELTDLDLRKPADARTLLDRLKQAAYHACGGNPKLDSNYSSRPGQTIAAYEECRANAVKRAIDQVGAPLLAQLYAECAEGESRVSAVLRTR